MSLPSVLLSGLESGHFLAENVAEVNFPKYGTTLSEKSHEMRTSSEGCFVIER
jgi:hypothetical protein